MDAVEIAKRAMNIAADLCVYTNHEHMVEVLESIDKNSQAAKWYEKLMN